MINLDNLSRLSSAGITAIRTNRIKGISWCFAPVLPVAYLATSWVFAREETDRAQRRRNREIFGQMFSLPVLFGETMILLAQCERAYRLP